MPCETLSFILGLESQNGYRMENESSCSGASGYASKPLLESAATIPAAIMRLNLYSRNRPSFERLPAVVWP